MSGIDKHLGPSPDANGAARPRLRWPALLLGVGLLGYVAVEGADDHCTAEGCTVALGLLRIAAVPALVLGIVALVAILAGSRTARAWLWSAAGALCLWLLLAVWTAVD